MYKYLLLIATIAMSTSAGFLRGKTASVTTPLITDNDEWKQFTHFQQKFAKEYTNVQEMEDRFDIFRTNLRDIIIHNLNSTDTFTKGINQFSDLTPDEFKNTYASGLSTTSLQEMNLYGATNCVAFAGTGASVPASVDWRTKNAVSPVKDQGQCGSCWSFSASGAMEGAWAIKHGELYSLSEQELVDCAGVKYGSMGCNGGQMDGAFKYAMDHGMCSETAYPYVSGTTLKSGSCASCAAVAKVSGCADVSPNNQKALKEAVANGPVSVAIEADTRTFQSYSSGILTSTSCGTNLDHGVLVVGYGTDAGQDYWIVKNSWSNTWGENGYIRIARSDSTSDNGICGIAMQPSFPVVV